VFGPGEKLFGTEDGSRPHRRWTGHSSFDAPRYEDMQTDRIVTAPDDDLARLNPPDLAAREDIVEPNQFDVMFLECFPSAAISPGRDLLPPASR
jgi:hypothetical protein